MLAVSGDLNLKMYGPGVYPDLPKAVLATESMPGHGWGHSPPEEQARRSVTSTSSDRRDADPGDSTWPRRIARRRCASPRRSRRRRDAVNSDFMQKQAALFAERSAAGGGAGCGSRCGGVGRATSRPPTDDEVKRGLDLIDALQKKDGMTPEAALKTFCLMAMNLNEFMYLD